jgi:oligopeptide/dipeptide ABC transporter ATP-binding protein
MYAGRLQEIRPARALQAQPRHPYTAALLASRPDIAARSARLPVVPGRPVSAFETPNGCAFAPRCPHATDVCRASEPAAIQVPDGMVRCVRLDELVTS